MASTTNILLVTLSVLYLVTFTTSDGVESQPGEPAADAWLRPFDNDKNEGAAPAPGPAPTYGKRSIARQKLKKRGKYCVPKTGTSDAALQKNIDYICKRIHDGCGPIQPGGACFNVDSSLSYRAAYVMHLYYNINERKDEACDFWQTGNITTINPTVDQEGCNFK